MNKKILALALIITMVFSTNVFAYTWVEKNGGWYVFNEALNEFSTSTLIDTGSGVYYLDSEGRMVTGWWRHPTTHKYYFFDNDETREYGSMVFGLHTVDGYYRYFGNDGSLQTSDDQNSFKKVYLDFYADATGKLYYNNEEMRDVSVLKSDYYSNPIYYTNDAFNNYYLAYYDKETDIDVIEPVDNAASSNYNNDGKVITTQANFNKVQEDGTKKSAASNVSGGTEYYVNSNGVAVVPDQTGTIKDAERLGPANHVD